MGHLAEGPGGEHLKILSRAMFKVQTEPVILERTIAVATPKDEVLQKDDIAQRDQEGPVDVFNSWNRVLFEGLENPLQTVGLSKLQIHIITTKDVAIPAMRKRTMLLPRNTYGSKLTRDIWASMGLYWHQCCKCFC